MQDHLDEATFDAHDDLVQCGAEDPFTGFCCRGRVRPSELEIDTEPHQLPPLSLSQRGRLFRLQLGNLALETMYDLQCLIPAALELASHQSVGGINSIILPPGIRRRELCGRAVRKYPAERILLPAQTGRLAKRCMSPIVCTQGNASSQNISRAGVIDFGSSRVPTLRTTTPGRVPGSWQIDEPHSGQKCRSIGFPLPPRLVNVFILPSIVSASLGT